MWWAGSSRASISVSERPFLPVAPSPRWSEPIRRAVMGWLEVGIVGTSFVDAFLSVPCSFVTLL